MTQVSPRKSAKTKVSPYDVSEHLRPPEIQPLRRRATKPTTTRPATITA